MPAAPWSLPAVLAHRCGGALAPENTLAGLAVAASLGCRGVEFDVMLSADQRPVLIHDETLDRTTDGSGWVADRPARELHALDAGGWFDARFRGERIPALEDALERCAALGLAVNLEIKPSIGTDEATADVVIQTLRDCWPDRAPGLLLSSFSAIALRRVAARAPEYSLGVLFESVPGDWRARCSEVRAISLHANARALDAATCAAVRGSGLRLACYTVNAPDRARELFAWGVDCVITDRPDCVVAPGAAPTAS